MSGVVIRQVCWRGASFRPTQMPSVECPRVHECGSDGWQMMWMGVSHCLACDHAVDLQLDFSERCGKVACRGAIESGGGDEH